MSDNPTICTKCKWLHADAKRDAWWRWLCTAAPRDPEYSFVTGQHEGEPFRRCKDLNNGDCGGYIAGPNCLSEAKLKKVPGVDNAWAKIEETA